MTRASSSLRWLTLAVLLPLLILGVLGWLGTQSQVRAAWSSAREEARAAAGFTADYLPEMLFENIKTAALFPDPPVPTGLTGSDAVLDGKDVEALRKLRDDPDAGLSSSGLPLRVLAGFRLYELTKSWEDSQVLVTLATQDEPSVLTAVMFSKLPGMAASWSEQWAAGDEARAVFRRHPEVDADGAWLSDGGRMWWLARDGKFLRYLDTDAVLRTIRSPGMRAPAWADFRLSENGRVIGAAPVGEVIASMPVGFTGLPVDGGAGSKPATPIVGSLRLEFVATHPERIEAAARQQARWTLALLASAVAVSAGALIFIHRAIEREQRLNAMKSDFVASVSHELRAPVASIRLMADALVAGKIEPTTAGEFHGLISREGARLSNLIENVLDFARIEQGRKRWHFESVDLVPLIAETLNLMGPLAAEKSITLISKRPPISAADVQADPIAIQQALVNLLDNAIKFSPANTQVEITLGDGGGESEWQLGISDQGPGIPASEHQRIFEKFHRLGVELRRETQGTGIGLSLVKAIAEAHGGRVTVASVVGKGSVFTLVFPKAALT